jgi:hypothetical protein
VTWKGIGADMLAEAGVVDLYDDGVAIPYRLRDGSTLYQKRIGVNGQSWYEPAPSETIGLIPFGLDSIPWGRLREDSILIVAEGESDALCCREKLAEIAGRRVYALGMPGAHSWRDEWLRYLRPFSAVFVCPDGDEPGKRMATKIQRDCRWARIVLLPEGDDLRSLMQRDGAEALLPLFDESTWLLQLDLGIRVCRTFGEMESWMRRPLA